MKAEAALAIWLLVAGGALAQAQNTGIWMGVGPELRAGVIKDGAFSADLVSTNDRTDSQPGLKTEFHGQVARNSQGTTYFAMEHLLPSSDAPRAMRITITDPGSQTVTMLDPQQKTAFISHVSATALGTSTLLTPGAPASASGRPVSVSNTTDPTLPVSNAQTEQLGTKTIDGLQVVGVRTTHTSPANTPDGKPFLSTVETWTSPELKLVVLTETQSSNGDRHVSKLTNVVRTEPSAALFQVPAGYAVRQNMPTASNVH